LTEKYVVLMDVLHARIAVSNGVNMAADEIPEGDRILAVCISQSVLVEVVREAARCSIALSERLLDRNWLSSGSVLV